MTKHICPPDHKHALNGTCYLRHSCGCEPCKKGRTEAARVYRRQQAYGTYDSGLVDAAPVRKHVLMLKRSGIGWRRIAELSGVNTGTVDRLIYGRRDPARNGEQLKRVSRVSAEKLLALRPNPALMSDRTMIPAKGTQRRVQALVARGWMQSRIAERVGMDRIKFADMMRGDKVSVRIHRLVVGVYDELWDVNPPATTGAERGAIKRALTRAQAKGWVPPMAWDDIDTDRQARMRRTAA